ncbi:MAG: hypothetical protein HQK49_04040 [Oligoflexia bacterium]|nr:hypothetical protein [Oligoflexia bacterium]
MKMINKCLCLCLISLIIALLISACSPTIYFVDRESIMETEAAGEWPNFEEILFQKNQKMGTTPLAPREEDMKSKKFNHVLNGELLEKK